MSIAVTRAEKSLLTIGRALEVKARLLVLDEPSASLPAVDVNRLFDVLRELRRQGVGMIYVSHRLDEVMRLSDRAAVMRDGKLVGVRRTADSSEAELVELIVGQPLAADERPAAPAPSTGTNSLLSLHGAVAGNAGPVDLDLHPGEILGLVGLRGAGQDAIGRTLFGCEKLVAGTLEVAGRIRRLDSPAQAIASGIGYTAGERLEQNLAGSMSVQENLFPNPRLHGERGFDAGRRRRELKAAEALADRFDVNPRSPHAIVQQLSRVGQLEGALRRLRGLDLESGQHGDIARSVPPTIPPADRDLKKSAGTA